MADEEKRLNGADEQPSSSALPENGETVSVDLGFTGNYTHGMDAKGRLIVPAAFRDGLGRKFAVCLSPDF